MDIDEHDGAASASAGDDLRSMLSESIAEHAEPASRSSSEPSNTTPASGDAPAAKTAVERARDAGGKFAPGSKEPAAQNPEAAPAVPETAPAATRRAPTSWSKANQDAFVALPPAIQDEVLKRESDVAKGFQDRAERVRAADDFDRVTSKYQANFAKLGLSPLQAADRLFAVESALQRDPAGTIAKIAQSYGVDVRNLQPQAAQNPAQRQAPQAPHPLERQVQSLLQREQAREDAARQEHQEQLRTQISDFATRNEHFDAVRPLMAQLVTAGQAANLQDAYDKAVWLEPTTRAAMIAKQTAPAAATAKVQADQDAAKRAKAAAVSVRGAPSGSAPDAPKATLRDELRAAIKG